MRLAINRNNIVDIKTKEVVITKFNLNSKQMHLDRIIIEQPNPGLNAPMNEIRIKLRD
jgi:hypothetical protein